MKNQDTRVVGSDGRAKWGGLTGIYLSLEAESGNVGAYPITVELDGKPTRRVRLTGPHLETDGGEPFSTVEIIEGARSGDKWRLYVGYNAADVRRPHYATTSGAALLVGLDAGTKLFEFDTLANPDAFVGFGANGDWYIRPDLYNPSNATAHERAGASLVQKTGAAGIGPAWDLSRFRRVVFSWELLVATTNQNCAISLFAQSATSRHARSGDTALPFIGMGTTNEFGKYSAGPADGYLLLGYQLADVLSANTRRTPELLSHGRFMVRIGAGLGPWDPALVSDTNNWRLRMGAVGLY